MDGLKVSDLSDDFGLADRPVNQTHQVRRGYCFSSTELPGELQRAKCTEQCENATGKGAPQFHSFAPTRQNIGPIFFLFGLAKFDEKAIDSKKKKEKKKKKKKTSWSIRAQTFKNKVAMNGSFAGMGAQQNVYLSFSFRGTWLIVSAR